MSFIKRDDATSITPPLSQAGGYVVVIVVGLVFAFGQHLDLDRDKDDLLTSSSNGLCDSSPQENSR